MDRINVTKSSMPPFEEYIKEIRSIWDNHWLTNAGPKHQLLVQELCKFIGAKEISLFSNGHQALEAAFSLFPVGSEVITTPFTFASTTLAIARAGLVPVFCDIDPVFYTMDPEKIEPLITEKTVAIAPVHVYGNVCDWKRIEKIAAAHELKVVYDAAHAFGVSVNGVNISNIGDIVMYSFHATKVFHTIEGGCLVHNDSGLSRYFTAWRQFGMFDGEQSEFLGTNAKLTEFAAAMGLCNLRHLDEQIAQRREAVLHYRQHLCKKAGIVLCPEQEGVRTNYAYFPVRVIPEECGVDRDQLVDLLKAQDIMARKYFHPLTSQFPLHQKLYPIQDTPIAQTVSEQILCLPLYAGLTEHDVARICDIIP